MPNTSMIFQNPLWFLCQILNWTAGKPTLFSSTNTNQFFTCNHIIRWPCWLSIKCNVFLARDQAPEWEKKGDAKSQGREKGGPYNLASLLLSSLQPLMFFVILPHIFASPPPPPSPPKGMFWPEAGAGFGPWRGLPHKRDGDACLLA